MVQYTPKELTGNVNVPRVSPWRELVVLLAGVLGIVLVLYFALGFAVDETVNRLSAGTQAALERRLSPLYSRFFTNQTANAAGAAELQRLLTELQQSNALTHFSYQVHLIAGAEPNAVALPGGHIVVTEGLVAAAESENELTMVLGHELGHFAHRDHLRGLGRGLVLLVMSTVLLGGDDAVSGVVGRSLGSAELKFSRDQEAAADRFGLGLLVKRYGHAGGCADFFERIEREAKQPRWNALLQTHPSPARRVELLDAEIRARGYRQDVKQPVPAVLRPVSQAAELPAAAR